MWTVLLSLAVGVAKLATQVGVWLHDRQERKAGQLTEVVQTQGVVLKAMNKALQAPRITDRADLVQKLQDGTL